MLHTWLLCFGVLFVAAAAWSLATPLGAAPDEPAQLIRAASLDRGQLVGHPDPDAPKTERGAIVVVQVPEVFASLANDIACFTPKPLVPAGCQGPLVPSPQDVPVETYVGRYQPLYYAIVGLPTLLLVSDKGIYGARLVSAALGAAMLALGLVSARRCRGGPLMAAAFSLAITPMALYLSGVINPSGLEISSAIAAWAGAMALLSTWANSQERVEGAALAALGLPLVVLALVRPLALLWALAVLATLVLLTPRGAHKPAFAPGEVAGDGPLMSLNGPISDPVNLRLEVVQRPRSQLARLLGQKGARIWVLALAGAAVVSLAWDVGAKAYQTMPGAAVPPGGGTSVLVDMALDRLHMLVTSSIGLFGWLDTPSPYAVTVIWLASFGALVLLFVSVGARRPVQVVVGLLAAWCLVAFFFVIFMERAHGVEGQGRDFMGLLVGAPLVAGAFTGAPNLADRVAARLSTIVIALLALGQAVDFYSALRRYAVGLEGPLDAFARVPGGWQPPVPGAVLVSAFALAMVAFAVVVYRSTRPRPVSAHLTGNGASEDADAPGPDGSASPSHGHGVLGP